MPGRAEARTTGGVSGAPAPRWLALTPNALSIVRIGLALALPSAPAGARLAIVLAAGATDLLDGWIARRFSVMSGVGGLLDAIADKLFTLSAAATLWWAGEIALWQVGVALVRDGAVVVAFVAALARGQASVFVGRSPTRAGKWATAFAFMWLAVASSPAPGWADRAAFIPAGTLSVLAALSYLRALGAALSRPGADSVR